MILKIFETLGKNFLNKRLVLWVSSALLGLSLCLFSFLLIRKMQLDEKILRLSHLYEMRNSTLEKRSWKKNFLAQYRNGDPLYLEKHLEPIALLSKETQQITALLEHPAFYQNELLKNRLVFLQGSQNRIHFKEESIRSARLVKEEELSFLHPIEVDTQDLEKILSLIEGVPLQTTLPPSRPQLIIQRFEMKKMHKEEGSDTFSIHLQLLKREFH
jgi:hypothetical protein